MKTILLILLMTACAHGWLYRIAWDYDTPATFRIYRGDNGGIPTLLDATADKLYLDQTIAEGFAYAYYVTAVGASESDPSDALGVDSGWRGDVNGDAVVDAADKRQLARWLAGNAEAVNRRADMDDNFKVNLMDLVLMSGKEKTTQ